MGEAEMRTFVDRINEVQPVQILAYVESAYELAQFIEQEGVEVHSPRAIMTSAGTLHDHMREVIRRVFRAPVFNRYGSREVGDIACECEAHEGLHVSAPTHYVEILRSDGTPTDPGEVGEIVVTLLTNYAMPLIRYRIGDMGAWAESSCSCGRSWPLLAEVTGRVSDTFVTDDGKRIHGEFFTHLFYGEEWVQKFQVIQESVRQITIAVVPSGSTVHADRRLRDEMGAIRTDIHSVMGETCDVRFDVREEIPPTDSGKYRYTISKVDRERA
jgi:phenylacetate-CoA ligase